jgi:predicted flap endonuclease-1-like 5' DNA nuclease
MDRRLRALISTALIVGAIFQAMNHVARQDEAGAWWDVLLLIILAILIWLWDWLAVRFTSSEPQERAIVPRPSQQVAQARAAGAEVIADLKAEPPTPTPVPPAPPSAAPVKPLETTPAEAVVAAQAAGAEVMVDLEAEPHASAPALTTSQQVAQAQAAGAEVIADLKAEPPTPTPVPPAPPPAAPVKPLETTPAEAVAAAQAAGAEAIAPLALPLHYRITGVTDGEVMDDHTHDVMLVPEGGQALRRVDIDLDGARQVSLIQPPYSYRLDGAGMAPGAHVLDFTVTGVAGDMERKRIHFTVPEPTPAAPPKPAAPPLAFELTGVMEGERVNDDTRDVMLKLAADQAEITRVDFDLDHERQVTLIQPPYSYRVDTAGLKPGTHSLYVTVSNSAGETRSVRRNFTIPEPAPAPVKPPPAPLEAAPAPAAVRAAPKKSEKDDLKLVEGIGPKFEKALNAAGILTFEDLAAASQDALHAAIEKAGMRFAPSIPTWSMQAAYLVLDDHAGLAIFQQMLTAGRMDDPTIAQRAPKPGTTPKS